MVRTRMASSDRATCRSWSYCVSSAANLGGSGVEGNCLRRFGGGLAFVARRFLAGAGAGACSLGACFSLTVHYTAPAPKSWPLNAWHAASASRRMA